MTQISFFDDPELIAKMCNRLADELEQRIRDGVSVVPAGVKRILVTSAPLAVPNWKPHNIIETSGSVVVCEEMCTGTRYFDNLVDEGKTTLDEQFMALSERYMKTNCVCFTPSAGRIDDIIRLAKEYKVDGVIDCSLKFCCLYDMEKYSVSAALKKAGTPSLAWRPTTPTPTPNSSVQGSAHLWKCSMPDNDIRYYILFQNYEQDLALHDPLTSDGIKYKIATAPRSIQGKLSCGMSLLIEPEWLDNAKMLHHKK